MLPIAHEIRSSDVTVRQVLPDANKAEGLNVACSRLPQAKSDFFSDERILIFDTQISGQLAHDSSNTIDRINFPLKVHVLAAILRTIGGKEVCSSMYLISCCAVANR